MIRDKLIHIDRKIRDRLKDRQRSFLPPQVRAMAKSTLAIPEIQETITNLGIQKALETAQRVSDFPTVAAIAFLQGFPRRHAVLLVATAAREYARDPSFLDASGHRLNMKQLRRKAQHAEAFNRYVSTISKSPREHKVVKKSNQVLLWQRRYNRVRKFIFSQPRPSATTI